MISKTDKIQKTARKSVQKLVQYLSDKVVECERVSVLKKTKTDRCGPMLYRLINK